ncbi:MAG: hypothetical protein ABSB19_18320 [Methylomonas sp.]|jgi:Spy/CpxP family protein refolding chaperone
MNTKILILSSVLLVSCSLAFADPVTNEDGPHGHNPKHLCKMLKLTPEQTEKVEAIHKEEHEKFRALHEEYHNKIKEVLTPEQTAKWEKMMAQHHKKHHHHHHHSEEAQTPSQ